MAHLLSSIFLIFVLIRKINAQNYYVAAPKSLRLNSDEILGVAVDGDVGGPVSIIIQDHPGKIKNVTEITVQVDPGKPRLFKIHLDADELPSEFLSSPVLPKYVLLTASFQGFRKELLIPINNQYGYMFVQTDKPIYTPKERVSFRIIPLKEDETFSYEPFQLQIRNPNNSIVEQTLFEGEKRKIIGKAVATPVYKFPTYPVLGEWSATVLYGYDFKQNSTVHFRLQEYVLPMFTVEVETPDVILPTDDIISIKVSAKYVFGKKVEGAVSFRLGIKSHEDQKTEFFAVISPQKLINGSSNQIIKTENLKRNKKIGWFPKNSHLVVEALVVDTATGNEEETVNSKCRFTATPFSISFKRSLEDFRPGHTSIIEADINYVNGQPAEGILTTIKAVSDKEQPIEIKQNSTTSDHEGKVSFEVRPELHHEKILITLTANCKEFPTEKRFEQRAFKSTTGSYIALDRTSQRLKPNDNFKRIIHYEPLGLNNIYYLVTAKGKILMMNKLPEGRFGDQHVSFAITYEMVPSFRILIFAHHDKELLVDSLKIDVEDECDQKAEVTIHPEFSIQEPGRPGKIIIRGKSRGTFVGLLGVDEAVYALSKKDILTKSKIFKTLDKHDLGCGAGGGISVEDILGKAGIILGTNIYSPSPSYSCAERKRRKRAAVLDIKDMYQGIEKECCTLGLEHDIHYRSCQERAAVVANNLKDEEYANCSNVFLHCCLYKKGNASEENFLVEGRTNEDDLDLIEIDPESEDDIESVLTLRSNFPETWIFQDLILGPDNEEEVSATLPHSITTWVIHAVSVSPAHGICVAEPKKIVAFQKIFLHLNLPYSVVRNEQVEIQATIFNYDQRPIRVTVYMYGAEGLCSSTQPGQKSERQYITIEGQSAGTVIFPVLPLKAEVIPIRVTALSGFGGDTIRRELNVIPEGITKEINIPITLDPVNIQKREKGLIQEAPYISDYINAIQNEQVTTVRLDLCLPEDFVPGTESCSITAIGDAFGPAVETAINNPGGLIQEPEGCGEQNMKNLAPTLCAVRYLKATGKLTADNEEKGYKFMQQGYANELKYRKEDGSYAAFVYRDSNTWLTAFVIKVFCQASKLIYIDENVLLSGIRWLKDNQHPDGSFYENYPMFESKLMGGIDGKVPLTAFVLITLEECKFKDIAQDLNGTKTRAMSYLENHLYNVNEPLSAAIVAYALSLSGSNMRITANDKLLNLAKYDADTNRMHWTTENSPHDIQTAGYALLTQLLLKDMKRIDSIVNWLNTKKLKTGAFESTQDTVIALQAMSEYAIRAQMPPINLVTRISSSNRRFSEKLIAFNEENAQVMQDYKIQKVGGSILINTVGQGTGSLSVNLRYNVIVPPEDLCKFDITVNVTETKHEEEDLANLRIELMSGRESPSPQPKENDKLKYRISICVRYLGDRDTDMGIVDVGIFSGFAPVREDLIQIERDRSHLIEKFELSKRSIIFYLAKVPSSDKYCFHFRVFRQFIVGNTQMSYIKVYDYYNPHASCTKSYKPISNSPLIRTICEGGICECAEGGCPPRTPFSDIRTENNIAERRDLLKNKFCEGFDYVWKGKLYYIRKEGGFYNISFAVDEVIKAGNEKPEMVEDEKRTFLARDNCQTAALRYNATYLILGKDAEGYMNEYNQIWYRYLLDQTSVVLQWMPKIGDLKDQKSKQLQRDLFRVTKALKEDGCDL